jgi:hypothetical protein
MKIGKKIYDTIMPSKYGRVWRMWNSIRYDIPHFLKNVWIYRAEIGSIYDWESTGSLKLLKRHLERLAVYLEKHGHEIEEPRLKKVEKIRRAVDLLDLHIEEGFTDWAEVELGEELINNGFYFEKIEGTEYSTLNDRLTAEEKAHNGRIYKRAQEIATETWMELFEILRGQDTRLYSILREFHENDHTKQAEIWNDWYDGSGMKHWWD